MSFVRISTFLTVFLLSCTVVSSFSCVCSPSECEDISEDDCPGGGGTVWDPCRCCRVCARIEGEPCGGPHGFYGTCADGLDCVVASHASGKPVSAANSEGICTRHPGTDLNCDDPTQAFGCNIIGNRCSCERVPVCGDELPFMFSTRDECSLNLAVMLEHESSNDFQQDFCIKLHRRCLQMSSSSEGKQSHEDSTSELLDPKAETANYATLL